ncbi:GpE family phage tail protein [Marinobacter salsuginis]|nr:GpE family phage tail protein [Marinobacter salsuginis]QTN40922.1 GpE family phage tail protein [Marinobacter salsuginis]
MADIAAIFHWRPSDMNDMPLSELMEWRDHARRRSSTEE